MRVCEHSLPRVYCMRQIGSKYAGVYVCGRFLFDCMGYGILGWYLLKKRFSAILAGMSEKYKRVRICERFDQAMLFFRAVCCS